MSEYKWRGSNETHTVSAYIDGIKFHWVADSGERETSGSGSLLARHFFKPRWQEHFKKIFEEKDFTEICLELKTRYDLFQSDPEAYNKSKNENASRAGTDAA